MKLAAIKEAAKSRLAGYTGFRRPRAVGIELKDGLYRVTVEIVGRPADGRGGEALRTYVVLVDPCGVCHGYAPETGGEGGK